MFGRGAPGQIKRSRFKSARPQLRSRPPSRSSPQASADWVCSAGAERRKRRHSRRDEDRSNFEEAAARRPFCFPNVRYWHLADMTLGRGMSAFAAEADIPKTNVRPRDVARSLLFSGLQKSAGPKAPLKPNGYFKRGPHLVRL